MLSFDFSFFLQTIPYVLSYLPVTLTLLILTIVFSIVIGAVLVRFKMSRKKGLRILADFYVWIVRCTPPIVLLFTVFYGLPMIVKAISGTDINSMNKMVFVVITFTCLFSANVAEILRSAYIAIDEGQFEAGVSVGLTPIQTFFRIIFPQMLPIGLPNFFASTVNLIKDGALAYTIGLVDMMGASSLLVSRNYGSYAIETYAALAVVYWAIIFGIEQLKKFFETQHHSKIKIVGDA